MLNVYQVFAWIFFEESLIIWCTNDKPKLVSWTDSWRELVKTEVHWKKKESEWEYTKKIKGDKSHRKDSIVYFSK